MLLSVITVCRGNADALRQTLRSFDGLDFGCVETIVIDGSPGDECAAVVSQLRTSVTAYVHGPDRSLYHAMNKGTAKARGLAVLFVNAGDEIYDAKRLSALVRARGPELARSIHYGGHVQAIGAYRVAHYAPPAIAPGVFVSHQAILVPTAYANANPYDENFRFLADAKFLKSAFSVFPAVRLGELVAINRHGGISSMPGSWLSVLCHCREAAVFYGFRRTTLVFTLRVVARKAFAAILGRRALEVFQAERALRRSLPVTQPREISAATRSVPADL